MTRRNFLRLLVALSAWVPASVLVAATGNTERKKYSISAFGPFLDTLLPAELGSPSATQLAVDKQLLDQIRANKRLTKIIVLGCAWLDQQAQKNGAKDFATLAEQQRVVIVTTAEQASAKTLPRVFFAWTHRAALHHYYIQPESWKSLGYSGPPQPAGFIGHDQAPAA